MAAEALQAAGAGGERVEEVEAAVASAGAFAHAAVEAYHHAGTPELLGQAAGRYADDALVPALAGEDYRPFRRPLAQVGGGLLPDPVLQLLPLAVEAAQLSRQGRGGLQRRGQQQPGGEGGVAQPAGGVYPRRQSEAHGGGAHALRAAAALLHQRGDPGARPQLHLLQAAADDIAVLARQWHDVRHRAGGHQVGVLGQQGLRAALHGAEQLEGDADAREALVWIGAAGPLRVHHGQRVGQPARPALVVVGDDEVESDALRVLGLRRGGYAAVHGDEQRRPARGDGVQGRGVEAVALAYAVGYVGQAVQPPAAQIACQEAGGGYAVHVVVAVYRDGLAPLYGLAHARGGPVHVQHQLRRLQGLRPRVQEGSRLLRRDDAAARKHRGQKRRTAGLQQGAGRLLRPARYDPLSVLHFSLGHI